MGFRQPTRGGDMPIDQAVIDAYRQHDPTALADVEVEEFAEEPKPALIGRPPIIKDPQFLGLRIERADMTAVKRLAKRDGVSRSEVVRRALAAYLAGER